MSNFNGLFSQLNQSIRDQNLTSTAQNLQDSMLGGLGTAAGAVMSELLTKQPPQQQGPQGQPQQGPQGQPAPQQGAQEQPQGQGYRNPMSAYTPESYRRQQAQQAVAGTDLTNPDSLLKAAKALSNLGFIAEAEKLVQRAEKISNERRMQSASEEAAASKAALTSEAQANMTKFVRANKTLDESQKDLLLSDIQSGAIADGTALKKAMDGFKTAESKVQVVDWYVPPQGDQAGYTTKAVVDQNYQPVLDKDGRMRTVGGLKPVDEKREDVPSTVKSGSTSFYYDTKNKEWVPIGGEGSGGSGPDTGTQAATRLQTLQNPLRNIDAAIAMTDVGAGNGWGNVWSFLPESEGRDLNNYVQAIRADVGLSELLELKKAGGTLGQVAIRELMSLESRISTLDPKAENFPQELRNIRRHYENIQRQVADEIVKTGEAPMLSDELMPVLLDRVRATVNADAVKVKQADDGRIGYQTDDGKWHLLGSK